LPSRSVTTGSPCRQHCADLGRGLVDRTDQERRIIELGIELETANRRRHRRTHAVTGDLQIARPLPLHNRAEHAVDHFGRRLRVVEDRRVDGHLAIDLQLTLERLHDVMKVQLRPAQRDLRTATDDQDWRLLGISTRDRIERIERARPIRDDRDSQPFEPCVSVGREPDARLVGTHNRRHPDLFLHRVDGEHEVARDAERMTDAQLAKTMKQVLGQVHGPVRV
jgi:hypothetical protein